MNKLLLTIIKNIKKGKLNMKKFAVLLIVLLSFIIPWLSYGSMEFEIPMPKLNADMYSWHGWDIEISGVQFKNECHDKTSILSIQRDEDIPIWQCVQIKYRNPDDLVRNFDQIRKAPNCKCPPSSYSERKSK